MDRVSVFGAIHGDQRVLGCARRVEGSDLPGASCCLGKPYPSEITRKLTRSNEVPVLRLPTLVNRPMRNSAVVDAMKILYANTGQVCGLRLKMFGGV